MANFERVTWLSLLDNVVYVVVFCFVVINLIIK
jgi:amino acid transporter